MTGRAYHFTVQKHEEFGHVGLKPDWYKAGEPVESMAAAHDILEHFPEDDGSTKGEILALGASLFIRGETGYFQRNGNIHPPWRHVASDFPNMKRRPEWYIPVCHKGSRLPEHVHEWMHEIAKFLRLHDGSDDCENVSFEHFEVTNAIKWLSRGYVMARRRYRKIGCCGAADLFAQIEKRLDAGLRYSEEGDKVTAVVNFRRVSVDVRTSPRPNW